jgi:rare lipoprotein A
MMNEGWRCIAVAACVLSGGTASTLTVRAMEMEPATTIIQKQPGPAASAPMQMRSEPAGESSPSLASGLSPLTLPFPMPSTGHSSPSPTETGAKGSWTTTVTREPAAGAKPAAITGASAAGEFIVPLPTRSTVSLTANAPASALLPPSAPSLASGQAQEPAITPKSGQVTTALLVPAPPAVGHREIGMASFYSGGGRTASGMKAGGMTAAHRKLPFGTRVKVRDVKTGKEVVVTIIDRGPFKRSRVIDLSHMAARELGITGRGIARVEVVSAN